MSEPSSTPGVEGHETVALAVASAGIVALVLGWLFGSRVLAVLGAIGALAGGGLYAREKLSERSEKIDAAESEIRSTLDDLDPVARAQVLADIVSS